MNPRYFKKINETYSVEAGNIIVAKPFWREEIYKRVVILILDHKAGGSTGLVLNKKSNLMIHDALPTFNVNKPLYFGGASDTKIISYVHDKTDIPDSVYLGNNLFWGGNFDYIKTKIYESKLKLDEINFYAGFVQWDGGQLVDEIEKDKWWVCEINSNELFSISPENLWEESLESCGHIYSMFSNIPDPSLS